MSVRERKLLSPRQVAAQLSVSLDTVYRLMRSDEFRDHVFRLGPSGRGSDFRISDVGVEAYLEKRRAVFRIGGAK
jgi:excisionase family DNA binding protein